MKKSVSLITALLISGSLVAQDADFSTWDTDNDGLIERHEFTNHFIDNYFKMWDPSGTRGVIDENFFKESYAGLDTDNDNFLSDEEWLIGYNYFYNDYLVYDDMDLVDVNNDGKVEYNEYYDALYETRFFTDVDLDMDNYISEYELANYVFDNWDMNDSGLINKSEFNQFEWYYLDV